MIRNRLHIIFALAFAMVVASSCAHREKNEPEPGVSSKNPYSDKVTFVIGNAASVSPETKSAVSFGSGRRFIGVQGDDSLFITSSVSVNDDPVFGLAEPAVKGAPVTTGNLEDFYISASFDETLKYIDWQHIGQDNKVTVNEQTLYDTGYYWPQKSLDFFATNFSSDAVSSSTLSSGADPQEGSSSVENYNASSVAWTESAVNFGYDGDGAPQAVFTYALPEPDTELRMDALNQPDYVFAITKDRVEEDGVVPLDFAHSLSAVTFKLGTEFLSETGRQVKEVSVSGVPSSGICTISPAAEGELNFDWNTEGADRVTYRQSVPSENANVPNNTVINDGEMTFMLIPHIVQPDAEIKFVFNLHAGQTSQNGDVSFEHEWTVSVNLSDLTSEWLPGKKYTYSISAEEIVGVEITDEFISQEPLVKGNLSITNTSNVPVYVRAYIVGWWENSTGDVVSPWTGTNGKFTGTGWASDGVNFTGQGSDWALGADGFFYCQRPLQPGEIAPKIFETYTLTVDPPVVGSKLILNIVTQAVLHHQVEQAWPGALQ